MEWERGLQKEYVLYARENDVTNGFPPEFVQVSFAI